MAAVIPFRGVLYNLGQKTGVLADDVVAPPYDIISEDYRDELYRKSPFNIVRIDYGKEFPDDTADNNKYTRACSCLSEWLKENILVLTDRPGFFVYEVQYSLSGINKILRGIIGLVGIEELGKGSIFPHECTHSKPKTDRLTLLRTCNANISPIFSLYNSPERNASCVIEEICGTTPHIEARDKSGACHRLWIINDPGKVEIIKNDLSGKQIFIADGHHRYETAYEFMKESVKSKDIRDTQRPEEFVMMFLANISDQGLTILPTHRLVKNIPVDTLSRLKKYFSIESFSLDEFDIVRTIAGRKNCIGLYTGDPEKWFALNLIHNHLDNLHPAVRTLDVSILHELIFKALLDINEFDYEMDSGNTLDSVKNGTYRAAFFLNPTGVEDVERVARASLRMPPKSTYFYPKLLTGLVLNKFSDSLYAG